MNDRDPKDRPGITRWLSDAVGSLAGGTGPGLLGRLRGSPRPQPPPRTTGPGPGPTPSQPAPRPPETPSPEATAADEARRAKATEYEERLAKLQRELHDANLMLMGKEAAYKNDLQEVQDRNTELLEKVVRLTHKERDLNAQILDVQFTGSGAKAELKKLDIELRDLKRQYRARQEELTRLKEQLEAQPGGRGAGPTPSDETAERLAEIATERDQLRQRLDQADGEISGLRQQLEQALSAPKGPPVPRARPVKRALRPSPDHRTAALNVTVGWAGPTHPGRGGPLTKRVVGTTEAPLFALAAGKAVEAAAAAAAERAHNASEAQQSLAAAEARGGFCGLPADAFPSPARRPTRSDRRREGGAGSGRSRNGSRRRRSRRRHG